MLISFLKTTGNPFLYKKPVYKKLDLECSKIRKLRGSWGVKNSVRTNLDTALNTEGLWACENTKKKPTM